MRAYGEFFGQFTVSENFNSAGTAIGKADGPQRRFIHAGAVIKLIQVADVDGNELIPKSHVVESPLGNTPDERHLAALETNTNGAARTRGLALAAAAAGFAVPAGFALA